MVNASINNLVFFPFSLLPSLARIQQRSRAKLGDGRRSPLAPLFFPSSLSWNQYTDRVDRTPFSILLLNPFSSPFHFLPLTSFFLAFFPLIPQGPVLNISCRRRRRLIFVSRPPSSFSFSFSPVSSKRMERLRSTGRARFLMAFREQTRDRVQMRQ